MSAPSGCGNCSNTFPIRTSVLGASRDSLQRVPGIGADTADAIARWQETIDLGAELRRIDEYGCHVLVQDR
jgi:predicted DNA-binding helix-hairpin-helix protein